MDALPIELLVRIFSFLGAFSPSWVQLQRACKKWHEAAHEGAVFHHIAHKRSSRLVDFLVKNAGTAIPPTLEQDLTHVCELICIFRYSDVAYLLVLLLSHSLKNVQASQLTADSLAALLPHFPLLETLICHVFPGVELFSPALQSACTHLKELKVFAYTFIRGSADRLAGMLEAASSVTSLDVTVSCLESNVVVDVLKRVVGRGMLRDLQLNANVFCGSDSALMSSITSVLDCSQSLTNVGIELYSMESLAGLGELVDSLSLIKTLRRLSLTGVHILSSFDVECIGHLAQLHSVLVRLGVGVQFDGLCGSQLASLVGSCQSLEHLHLNYRESCDDHGVQSLLSTLTTHPSITHIKLAHMRIVWSEENQLLVTDIINHNTQLKSIELDLAFQSPLAVARLAEGINGNHSLRKLSIDISMYASNTLPLTPLLQSLKENTNLLRLHLFGQPMDHTEMELLTSSLVAPHIHLLSINTQCQIGTP